MNAAGRLSDAEDVVRLLISTTYEEAYLLAKKIDNENTQRQKIGRKILAQAKTMIDSTEDFKGPLVLSSPEWHQGVVGICASRLSEEFFVPTVLLAIDEQTGDARGSARSISGFDIYSAIKKCGSDLNAFGGHKAAAGLSLAVDKIDSFRKNFTRIVKEELADKNFAPIVEVDAEISLDMLTDGVLQELENLSPFGPDNRQPVFSSFDINDYSSMTVGKGHLKLKIKEDGQFFDAIGFNMAAGYCLKDEKIRLAFVPQFHSYNGEKSIQLNLKDIKYVDLKSAANN
jgi:single-stranded-DNA-specific exonuclease